MLMKSKSQVHDKAVESPQYKIPGINATIPMIGFCTQSLKEVTEVNKCIEAALQSGCRLFDTSPSYKNEKLLGSALAHCMEKFKVKREDLFIISKLPTETTPKDTLQPLKKSLALFNFKYFDLYVLESPKTPNLDPRSPENVMVRRQYWQDLINAQKKGLVRFLGVSNFSEVHLRGLLENCYGVKPVVNQIEWHPLCRNPPVETLCKQQEILIQAYNVLGESTKQDLFTNKTIIKVAKEHSASPAKVLLRWAIQQGFGVIPSSNNPDHILDNMQINFELTENNLKVLNNMRMKDNRVKM